MVRQMHGHLLNGQRILMFRQVPIVRPRLQLHVVKRLQLLQL
jgi:hypothetical protein